MSLKNQIGIVLFIFGNLFISSLLAEELIPKTFKERFLEILVRNENDMIKMELSVDEKLKAFKDLKENQLQSKWDDKNFVHLFLVRDFLKIQNYKKSIFEQIDEMKKNGEVSLKKIDYLFYHEKIERYYHWIQDFEKKIARKFDIYENEQKHTIKVMEEFYRFENTTKRRVF